MSSVEKRGDRWLARWYDDSGKQRAKTFTRKGDAQRFLVETDAALAKGDYTDPRAGKRTLADYVKGYLLAQTTEASTQERLQQMFRLHILPQLGDVPLAELSRRPSLISSWLAGLERGGMAPSYMRTCLASLSGALSSALDDNLITRNPVSARSVRAPRAARPDITMWEPARVAAVRSALPARYRPLTDLGAYLGMRQGEIFALSPDDIDWLRGIVRIRRQVRIVRAQLVFAPPKARKEKEKPREVPLPGSVKLRLAAHLEQFPAVAVTLPWREPDGRDETVALMLTSRQRTALNRNYFNEYVWKPALEAAGVPATRENGTHVLRHSFASTLLAGGIDVRTLAEYLGHSDPGFTLRVYGHLVESAPARVRAVIDAALAGEQDQTSHVLSK